MILFPLEAMLLGNFHISWESIDISLRTRSTHRRYLNYEPTVMKFYSNIEICNYAQENVSKEKNSSNISTTLSFSQYE